LGVRLVRLRVADADVDALHDHALGLGVHLEHAAGVALGPVHVQALRAGDRLRERHRVALLDVELLLLVLRARHGDFGFRISDFGLGEAALIPQSALRHPQSEDFGGEGDDAHELLVAQLAGDRPEDAGAARLVGVVDEDGGVLVEADVGAVLPAVLLLRADDDGLRDVALLHVAAGHRVLDRDDDLVADAGVAALRAAEDADAEVLLRPAVVGDVESGFLLDHGECGFRISDFGVGGTAVVPQSALRDPQFG